MQALCQHLDNGKICGKPVSKERMKTKRPPGLRFRCDAHAILADKPRTNGSKPTSTHSK